MLSAKSAEWPEGYVFHIGKTPVVIPSLRDPRYYFWLFQVSFFILLVTQVHMFRPQKFLALAVACTTGFLVDLLCAYWKTGKLVFPQSGMITGSGVSLILEGSSVWYYAFAVGCGVLAKHAITFRGRHVFNPNAYGLLLTLSLFPASAVAFAAQWGNSFWMPAYVATAGVIITVMARAINTSLFWLGFFILFAGVRCWLMGTPFLFALSPATGGAFMLFTFFMITDPRTVAKDWWLRFAFCAFVAAVDAFLRTRENHLSIFWALCVGYVVFIPIRAWVEDRAKVATFRPATATA